MKRMRICNDEVYQLATCKAKGHESDWGEPTG
jgi:hypothetical protein